MEGNAERFSSILKEYVFKRRKANPNISESQIAQALGISNTTFYRMLYYHTYPNVPNLFKLCKSIPELKTFVAEEMQEVTNESKTGKYIGKELEKLLCHENLFITYALALSSHGVTDEEIVHCIGHEGKQALKILIKKGFIMKAEDTKYRATKADKGIIRSFDLLKKHLEILAANYKPDNVKNNYICYKMETLNNKGLKKLYEIHKETHRKVQKLMEKKEYNGDMPIFSANFFDMFFTKAPINKKRIEK